jgi:hypothetical protein
VAERKPPVFPGVETFLFGAGLYARYVINNSEAHDLFRARWRIDGHCPWCHKNAVFTGSSTYHQSTAQQINATMSLWQPVTLECARNDSHEMTFDVKMQNGVVTKVGQFPALADIANDEAREYRKILGQHDSREFSKAIGLATHGVGIGSFVYLRRIFERLINSRFEEFKTAEGWTDDDFRRGRMDEKIDLLASHLPDFLVRNKRIYGILSQGIHDLDDDNCLAFFPVLKQSIIVILEQDKKKMEELARQKELERAIAAFSSQQTADTPSAGEPDQPD